MKDIDPVDEVRAARETLAARFDFDLRRIGEYIRGKQKVGDRKVVSFAPRPPGAKPEKPTAA